MTVLADALEHLVRGIVEHPDDVRVDLVTTRRGRTLEVRVHPEDLGKVFVARVPPDEFATVIEQAADLLDAEFVR